MWTNSRPSLCRLRRNPLHPQRLRANPLRVATAWHCWLYWLRRPVPVQAVGGFGSCRRWTLASNNSKASCRTRVVKRKAWRRRVSN